MIKFNKFISSLLAFVMLFSAAFGNVQVAFADEAVSVNKSESVNKGKKEKVKLIVKYKDGRKSNRVKSDIESSPDVYSVESIQEFSVISAEALEIETTSDIDEVISELLLDENVEYAQPNYTFEILSTPTDTDFGLQWGLKNDGQDINGQAGTADADINVLPVWNGDYDFSDVTVGVLDTGIDVNHPELSGKIVAGWDFANDDDSVFDEGDVAHGTQISGIIAANHDGQGIAGVAPNVKIMPLKFIQDGVGYTSDAINAIEYAKEQGVKMINCSWGSDIYNPALKDVMEQNSDILFVCAAGNNGSEQQIYPAAFGLPNVISVTAIDNTGKLWDKGNYGASVDIAAPGKDIYTTGLGNTYGYVSGTSMAAAFVSGAVGLFVGNQTDKSFSAIETVSAVKQTKNMNQEHSSGLVDAFKLIAEDIEFIPPVVDFDDNEKIPQELLDILESGGFYRDLTKEQKKGFLHYYHVRTDTMEALNDKGFSIGDSIERAWIMQRFNLNYDRMLQMIEAQNGLENTLSQSSAFVGYKFKYRNIEPDEHEEIIDLIAEGYKADKIIRAFAVAKALDLPIRQVIRPLNEADANEFPGFSAEEQKILADLSNKYYVDIECLNEYMAEKSLSIEEIWQIVLQYQYAYGMFAAHRNEALAAEDEMPAIEVPSAPYNFSQSETENMNLNTGALIYKEKIATIPGVNGLDMTLELQYDSSRSNPIKPQARAQIIEQNIYVYELFMDVKLYASIGGGKYSSTPTHSYTIFVGSYSTYALAEYYKQYYTNNPQEYNNTLWVYSGNGWIDVAWLGRYDEIVSGTKYNYLNDHIQNDLYIHFDTGVGWSLNTDRIRFKAEYYSTVYRGMTHQPTFELILANGASYSIISDQDSYKCWLEGYRLEDIQLEHDMYEEYDNSYWKLTNINGTIEYFDYSGIIMATIDKYGNTITYTYVGNYYPGSSPDYVNSTVITDTTGGVTKFEEMYVNNGSLRTGVVVTLPDGSQIKYTYTSIDGAPYLTSKKDALGNITTYEYTKSYADFNGWFTTYGIAPVTYYSMNLTAVNHPTGAKTIYEYEKATAVASPSLRMDYYRVSSRVDKVNGMEYNKYKYTYSSNNYLDVYDGYSTTVHYPNGQITSHAFNKSHLKTTISSSGESTKFTYNSNKLPTKVEYTLSGKNNIVRTDTYTYDDYGNVLSHNNGLDTIYYTYDYTYNMPLKKTYKKDASTTIYEQNYLHGQKKSINQHDVVVNNIVADRAYYNYDRFGNVIERDDWYYENAHTFTYTSNGAYLESNYLNERFIHDGLGRMLTYTDPRGNVTSYEYDKAGRITKIKNPDGTFVTNTYIVNSTQNRMVTKDEKGIETIYDYDGLGNISSITRDGVKTNGYKYDTSMRLSEETDANNIKTTYTYDSRNRLTSKTIGSSYKETYTYSDADTATESKVTKTIEGDANAPSIVTAVYTDIFGRTTRQTRLNGTAEYSEDSFLYDYLNNKIQAKNSKGQITKYEYDFAGRVTKVTNPDNSVFTSTYDSLGRKTSVTDPKSNTSKFVYNIRDQITKEEIPFENGYVTTKTYVYDANGNVTSQKITNSKPGTADTYSQTDFTYDKRNRLLTTKMFDKGVVENYTEYKYDSVGNKTEMLTANGVQSTKYEYDAQNRLTKLTDALNQQETYSYDKNGNLTDKTDRNGNKTVNAYNELNLLTSVKTTPTTGAAKEMKYTYAKTGAKLTEQNDNLTTTFVYNNLGRLKTQTESNGIVKNYEYDTLDNRTKMTVTQNGSAKLTQTYDYDNMNRLTKTYDNGTLAATYTYDKNGNRDTLVYPNGVSTKYYYNNANMVTKLENKKDAAFLSSYDYTYYLDGNQATKTDHTGKKTTYLYDGLGRLTKETESEGSAEKWSKAYTYDKASNRQTMSVTGTETYTTRYVYDRNNRLITETKSTPNETTPVETNITDYHYDKNGNQISKMSYSQSSLYSGSPQLGIYVVGEKRPIISNITSEMLEYDVFNQLVQVKNDNGTSTYAYKPDGLRAGTTKKGVMGSTGSEDVTTAYIWDGSNIIAETTGNEITMYIRGINLIAANKNGAKNYYLYNAHGDVIQMANASGTLIKSYQYDSFGVEIDPDPNDTNVWRYAGEMFDKETGNYYLRARYYDPANSRMLSEDTVRSVSGKLPNGQEIIDPLSLNLYTYCYNNPISFVDPGGHTPVSVTLISILVGSVIGFVVGGVVNYAIQGFTKGSDNINMQEVWLNAGLGAITGGISGSTLAWQIAVGINSIIGAANYAGTQYFNGNEINLIELCLSAFFGGVAGAIGGTSGDTIKNFTNAQATFRMARMLGLQSGQSINSSLMKQIAVSSTASSVWRTALGNIVTNIGPWALKLNSTGESVTLLQNFLGLNATGEFDKATEAALRSLQNQLGIKTTGIYDKNTADAIRNLL